jgi:hypothetical protein
VGGGQVWIDRTDATSVNCCRGPKEAKLQTLLFLGVNQNVKREWKTIHQAFGGIGIFSFAVEQMIGMIYMFIQHFEASTTLARKFMASLEALQLEIGCIENPPLENYDNLVLLATACWVESFWECLQFHRFAIHMKYATLQLP